MRAFLSALVLSLLLLALLLPPAQASADCPNGQCVTTAQLLYVAPLPSATLHAIPLPTWKPYAVPMLQKATTYSRKTQRRESQRVDIKYRIPR